MTDFWELSLLWVSVSPFPAHTQSFPLNYELKYEEQIAAGTLTQSASWLFFDLLLLPLNSTGKIPVILYERELTCWPPPWASLGWPLFFVDSDVCSLVVFSAKTYGSILQFRSSCVRGVTTQLLSQHTNLKFKSWTGKIGTLGKGKDIGSLSVPLSAYCSVCLHCFILLS